MEENTNYLENINNNILGAIENYEKLIETLEKNNYTRFILGNNLAQELLDLSIGEDLLRLSGKINRLVGAEKN